MKAARIFGLLFNKAKKLDQSKEMSDVIANLLEIISANRKDVKFKQVLLPALGELIFFLSCQESLIGKQVDNWTITSSTYVTLIRNIGVRIFKFLLHLIFFFESH